MTAAAADDRGTAMSWQDAHRYRTALRTAEADLNRTGGLLIWRGEYAEVFGSRSRLWLALRSHWQTMVQAQAEFDYELDGTPSVPIRDLVDAHPGLARALGVAGTTEPGPTWVDAPGAAVTVLSAVGSACPLVGAA
jgi:hypothetical protein